MKSKMLFVTNSTLSFLVNLCFTLLLFAIVVDAKYPVHINSSEIKFSPRLIGRSSVVYQNEMYVYGGETVSSKYPHGSNNMYKYTFDIEKDIVSMSLVNQVNLGPNCSFCGAVMINDYQMMILTHEYANMFDSYKEVDLSDPLTKTMVRPYVFDFTSNTWSLNLSTPKFTGDTKIFHMRRKHNTVFHNGVVYTLGGTDFYGNGINALNTSWYYDIQSNSYGVINNNGFDYRSISGNSFALSNNNIGSIYGRRQTHPIQYNNNEYMMILDTDNKSWTQNKSLKTSGYIHPIEGAVMHVSRQENGTPDFAYFFGGFQVDDENTTYAATPNIEILNLQNYSWLLAETIHKEKPINYVRSRSHASSSFILNKYFVISSGETKDDISVGLSDLDIVQLPAYKAENTLEENDFGYVEPTFLASISENIDANLESKRKISLSSAAKFFIILFSVLAGFIVIIYIVIIISRRKCGNKKKLVQSITLPSLLWYRRVGESFTTQVFRLIARIISFAIFVGFIYYFVNSVINSPMSTTEESFEKENVTFPDIRFCYTGWSRFDSVPRRPTCLYRDEVGDDAACKTPLSLDSEISAPAFAEQYSDATCFMYFGGSNVSQAASTLRFLHIGALTNNNQMLRIQLYEPSKNLNRVLYFNEEIKGLDVYDMDKWMDAEMASGTKDNSVDQMVYSYMDSTVYIQFKVITTKKINPNNLWNYVGIYPDYIIQTNMVVTHTEYTQRGNYSLTADKDDLERFPGDTYVSPADFLETVITEKRNTTIVSVLGVIGGVVSLLMFIQVLLFGTKPISPWGLIQNSSLTNSNNKRKNLSKYFLIPESGGLPLETPVHSRFSNLYSLHSLGKKNDDISIDSQNIEEKISHENSYNFENKNGDEEACLVKSIENESSSVLERLNKLEARNQILELVLKTYYIDDRVFRELQEISEDHIRT